MLATWFTSIKRLDKVDWTGRTDIRLFWFPALVLSGCQAKANHLFLLCSVFQVRQVPRVLSGKLKSVVCDCCESRQVF